MLQMMKTPDPSLQLFAGVDGGGTKCRVRIRDAGGTLLGEAVGGSGNVRLGLELVWSNILGALDEALAQTGRDRGSFAHMSLGLGLAGISSAEDAVAMIKSGPAFARIDAASDAHAACLGAFSGRDGGILISGTGSAAYAWVSGRAHQIGGWGFEVCDYGSAADLGREGIRAALNGLDGLAAESDFTRALLRHFGGHPAKIVHWVTNAKPRDYGELAPLVMQYAQAHDVIALQLVEKSAQDLGRYIARLHEIGASKVSLVGGMAPVFSPYLSLWAQSVLTQPEHDALEGAILLAHGMSNGLLTEMVNV